MKNYLVFLCMVPFMAHATFELETSLKGNDRVNSLLRDVEATLPLSIKSGINKKITVGFGRLDFGDRVIWGQVIAVPLNKARASHVQMNEKLLNELEDEKKYHLAKSTLLHEISHIYDFQNLQVGHEKDLNINDKSYTVSDSPVFLNVSGWYKKTLTHRLGQSNTLQSRRVDVYEDKNPQETFAVNIEHFLQDPQYKCRRPSMYAYMAKALDHRPFEDAVCEQEHRLPPTINIDGSVEKQKVIDPARLYEVHYFFAGKGTNIMSRWGHAMLRLVMCAPTRPAVDEKCLQDRAHHLILSFRADITNFNIDYIKGLTGKYTSKMFVLNMVDVIKEYNVGELRDLYSIPLKMNEEQKGRLVSQVLERYWGYESKYYFMTNNCADETLNILKNVYQDDLDIVDMSVLTPLAIKDKFEKAGISDMSLFEDSEAAKISGHLFEGLGKKLERIFSDLIEKGALTENDRDYEKFLNESTIERRKEIADMVLDPGIIGKLIFIEETIINRKLLSFQQAIGKELDKEDRSKNSGSLIELYRKLEELRKKKSGLDLKRGYGVPQKSDEIFGVPNFTSEDDVELKKVQKEFGELLQTKYAKEQKDITESLKHKQQILGKMLKSK